MVWRPYNDTKQYHMSILQAMILRTELGLSIDIQYLYDIIYKFGYKLPKLRA